MATRVAECGDDDGKVTSSYGYVNGGYGTNSTTPLVASISQKGISFAYTYDSRGNIASETRTDASGNSLTTTYAYDALGQLVRVNDPHEDASWVFNYDRGGNITSKVRYCPEWSSQGYQATFLPAGTVVIDGSLCGYEQKTRRRFTEAHEASHWMLHRSFHSSDKREFSFRTDWHRIACRSSTIERFNWNHNHDWTDNDWEEWQADSLAAALLMPCNSFREAVETAMRHHGFRQRYLVKGEKIYESNSVINEVANLFGVSRKATQIRMSQFNMIR